MGNWDILLKANKEPSDGQKQPSQAQAGDMSINKPPPQQGGTDGNQERSTGQPRSKQIKAMFRAGYDYYTQHNPENWRGLVFGETGDNQPDTEYWGRAAEDINTVAAAFGNDTFIIGLLMELYDEMEREYQTMREGALNDGEKQSTEH